MRALSPVSNSLSLEIFSVFRATVNVLKFSALLCLFLKIMLVIKTGVHKMHVRISNREDPDQTAS